MARTLRAEPSALLIAIRFLAGAYAPGHQAAAAGSRPREQARVNVCRSAAAPLGRVEDAPSLRDQHHEPSLSHTTLHWSPADSHLFRGSPADERLSRASAKEPSPGTDPNLSHPSHVVTVKRNGYTISGLVTHLQDGKTYKYAIALFPGHPGIMRLREENLQPKFELGGNFLVRSRRYWLDGETLVVVVDAPSDQWTTFSQQFRETPRYGTDVEALLKEIGR